MLLQLLQHLSNGLHVFFAFVFGIDEDVIEVHYHENVDFLYQDLIDIALEHGRCVGQSKRHYLVLEMAIVGPKNRLSFIAFFDPHAMVGIGLIELGKVACPT